MDTLKAVFGALVGLLLSAMAVQLITSVGKRTHAESPMAETAASSSASATAPPEHAAAVPEPHAQPATQPQQPQPAPELSHESYVASEDADVFHFVVNHPSKVKLRVMIEGDVPLDIVAFSGKISREQWVIAATGGETISLLAALFGGQSQSDVFATPLSKKAAFRMFESPWAKAEPGQYTVILDNTQAYTPSRGDAFVKLELYSTQ